jgi:hypothetical protein
MAVETKRSNKTVPFNKPSKIRPLTPTPTKENGKKN